MFDREDSSNRGTVGPQPARSPGTGSPGSRLRPWTLILCLLALGCQPAASTQDSGETADAARRPPAPVVASVLLAGDEAASSITALRRLGTTLWIGTRSGLHMARLGSGKLAIEEDGETQIRFKDQEITALAADGDRVLACTAYGYAVRSSSGGWTGEDSGRVQAMASHGGILYVGRTSGVERKVAGIWGKIQVQPPLTRNQTSAQSVNTMEMTAEGQLWVGTRFGLLGLDTRTGVWRHLFGSYQDIRSERSVSDETGNCDLAGNYINVVRYEPEAKKLLVGTDIGVSIMDGETGQWKSHTGEHTKYMVQDSELKRITVKGNLALPDSEVHGVLLEGSTLWIGTRGGLARLSGSRLDVLDGEDGLPDDAVTALEYDPSTRRLFVGTPAGLAVVEYR